MFSVSQQRTLVRLAPPQPFTSCSQWQEEEGDHHLHTASRFRSSSATLPDSACRANCSRQTQRWCPWGTTGGASPLHQRSATCTFPPRGHTTRALRGSQNRMEKGKTNLSCHPCVHHRASLWRRCNHCTASDGAIPCRRSRRKWDSSPWGSCSGPCKGQDVKRTRPTPGNATSSSPCTLSSRYGSPGQCSSCGHRGATPLVSFPGVEKQHRVKRGTRSSKTNRAVRLFRLLAVPAGLVRQARVGGYTGRGKQWDVSARPHTACCIRSSYRGPTVWLLALQK